VSLLFQVAEGSADPDLARHRYSGPIGRQLLEKKLSSPSWWAITHQRVARERLVGVVIPRGSTTQEHDRPAGPNLAQAGAVAPRLTLSAR